MAALVATVVELAAPVPDVVFFAEDEDDDDEPVLSPLELTAGVVEISAPDVVSVGKLVIWPVVVPASELGIALLPLHCVVQYCHPSVHWVSHHDDRSARS